MTIVIMEGAEDEKECEIKLVMTTVTMGGTSSTSRIISKDILVALTTILMAAEESNLKRSEGESTPFVDWDNVEMLEQFNAIIFISM